MSTALRAASHVQQVVGGPLGGHGRHHEPRGSSVHRLQQKLGRSQRQGGRGRSGPHLHPAGILVLVVGAVVSSIRYHS